MQEVYTDKIQGLITEMVAVQMAYVRKEFEMAALSDNELGRKEAQACIWVAEQMGWKDLAYEMKADIS